MPPSPTCGSPKPSPGGEGAPVRTLGRMRGRFSFMVTRGRPPTPPVENGQPHFFLDGAQKETGLDPKEKGPCGVGRIFSSLRSSAMLTPPHRSVAGWFHTWSRTCRVCGYCRRRRSAALARALTAVTAVTYSLFSIGVLLPQRLWWLESRPTWCVKGPPGVRPLHLHHNFTAPRRPRCNHAGLCIHTRPSGCFVGAGSKPARRPRRHLFCAIFDTEKRSTPHARRHHPHDEAIPFH